MMRRDVRSTGPRIDSTSSTAVGNSLMINKFAQCQHSATIFEYIMLWKPTSENSCLRLAK